MRAISCFRHATTTFSALADAFAVSLFAVSLVADAFAAAAEFSSPMLMPSSLHAADFTLPLMRADMPRRRCRRAPRAISPPLQRARLPPFRRRAA